MADSTPQANGSSAGDTLEFLKLAGLVPSGGDASAHEQQPVGADLQTPPGVATLNMPTVSQSERRSFKPVVIKGGPRRVVRADGVQPDTSDAQGQRRFALSSGHEMFVRRRKMGKVTAAIIGVVVLLLIAAIVVACWNVAQSSARHDRQVDAVGTSSYDNALSLTPADDGGYYTVFFVTSTPTNEDEIGTLAQVAMYRTDKARTSAMLVEVPSNLAVSVSSLSGEGGTTLVSLGDVLVSDGVSDALDGIADAFGLRLYDVVVIGQQDFDALSSIMDGTSPTSSVDPQSLLGHVRSSFTLEEIVGFAGDIAAIGAANVGDFTPPTVAHQSSDGQTLLAGLPDQYRGALNIMLSKGVSPVYDEYGYLAGTQYDEYGTPLVDENGNPQGTVYDEAGLPEFDDTGHVLVYGQRYDENGWPVGTQYDEAGNPLLDEWGNPLGTQYDEYGNFVYDELGNLVISS